VVFEIFDINEASRWSNISQFASTSLAKSTIAAPFVAFLIFFNDKIREWLALEAENTASGFWAHILEIRLEVFYVGLVLLGASITLYSIFASRTVTRQKNYSTFLSNKLATKSVNAVSASFVTSLRQIASLVQIPEVSIHDGACDRVPKKVLDSLHRIVENEFHKCHPADIRDEDFPDELAHFYSGNGYLLVDLVFPT